MNTLYAGIDLHSNNSVLVISNEKDVVLYEKRLKNDLDGILAACARADIPDDLLSQLADGGRLVMPVGGDRQQILTVVDREGDQFHTQTLDPVRFVPFQRGVLR